MARPRARQSFTCTSTSSRDGRTSLWPATAARAWPIRWSSPPWPRRSPEKSRKRDYLAAARADELRHRAGVHALGEGDSVPIGQADAAVTGGLADLGRIGRAVNAIVRSVQGDPHHPNRTVRARFDMQLAVAARTPVQLLRVVYVVGVPRDAVDFVRA